MSKVTARTGDVNGTTYLFLDATTGPDSPVWAQECANICVSVPMHGELSEQEIRVLAKFMEVAHPVRKP